MNNIDRRGKRHWLRVVAALVLFAPHSFSQSSAAISGHVYTVGPNRERSYIPGAEIALHCAAAPSNAKTLLTDAQGAFAVQDLEPARCELTASAAGFQPSTQLLELAQGDTVHLSLELKLAMVRQDVTVSGQAEGIDVKQTSAQGELTGATLEHAPSENERVIESLPLLPGVVRGPSGQLNIKGARASESGLLVNSANVTDPVTGEYGFDLPVEVVQNVKVLSNPYDAEYGKFTGAVTSIETRSGADKVKIQLQNFFPRPRYRDGAIVGIGSITPRFTLSGPIIKGKAYFLQSFEYRLTHTRVKGLKHLDRSLGSDTDLESFDSHTQTDWELSPSDHLRVSLSFFPETLRYVGLNTFNPQGVSPNYVQRGFLLGAVERKVLADQSLLESFLSVKKFDVDVFPSRHAFAPMILRPEQNEGSSFNTQNRASWRYETQEIYHLRPFNAKGQHLVRLGFDVEHNTFDGASASAPVLVEDSVGRLRQSIAFTGSTALESSSTLLALFLQDMWTPLPRITLSYGVRYEHDELGENNNVSPRAGFSVALTNDQRTVLRGGVGLFFDKLPLNAGVYRQLQSRTLTRFAPDGLTPLAAPLQFRNVIAGNHLDNPQSLAWNTEIDREVAHNLFLRAGYQQRQTRRQLIVTPRDGAQPQLLLGSFGRSLYREFEVAGRYRLRERSGLVASYVRSRSTGDLNDLNLFFANFDDPIIRPNERSLLPFDATNRFLAWGDLSLPKDIIFSPVLDVHTGFPFSLRNLDRDFIGARNRAGRFPTFASFDLQVTKGVKIPIAGHKLKGRLGVRVFNVFDHFNPRDVQNIVGSQPVGFREQCNEFGAFCNSVGRTFRGKFVFDF